MISEHAYRKVEGNIVVRELDLLVVAGKTEPIRVYELIGMSNDGVPFQQLQSMEFYTTGLRLFRERQWQGAIEMFEKALNILPNDYPSQLYIERSRAYLTAPPPRDWNGVFVLQSK